MEATTNTDDYIAGFARAMRRLASTVCVVATHDGKQPYGMVATAVTSLSAAPPSLLVCINRDASSHDVIARIGRFSVTLLRKDQREISDHFGSRYTHLERFGTARWTTAQHWQLPHLESAQATLFCHLAQKFEHGTHTVFIGNVLETEIDEAVDPLLYADGSYRWLNRADACPE